MCISGKIMYSRKTAGTIVNSCIRGHRRTKAKRVPCRVYFCQLCRTFHTTHLTLKQYEEFERRFIKTSYEL